MGEKRKGGGEEVTVTQTVDMQKTRGRSQLCVEVKGKPVNLGTEGGEGEEG